MEISGMSPSFGGCGDGMCRLNAPHAPHESDIELFNTTLSTQNLNITTSVQKEQSAAPVDNLFQNRFERIS